MKEKIYPIRTVEEFKESAANWEFATMVSTSSDNREEIEKADVICSIEEKRWDECRHLFEFSEDGDLVGLK
jgi:hypothetical protein